MHKATNIQNQTLQKLQKTNNRNMEEKIASVMPNSQTGLENTTRLYVLSTTLDSNYSIKKCLKIHHQMGKILDCNHLTLFWTLETSHKRISKTMVCFQWHGQLCFLSGWPHPTSLWVFLIPNSFIVGVWGSTQRNVTSLCLLFAWLFLHWTVHSLY